jgi:cell division septum initiation protein DivIVA
MTTQSSNAHEPLPTAFRGYAREPVDSLLAKLENKSRTLLDQRKELQENLADMRSRLAEATRELEHRAGEEHSVEESVRRAEELEEKCRALAAERDGLQSELAQTAERLSVVEKELERHLERELAVADALIAAEQLKAEGETLVEAMKLRAAHEAEEIRAGAEQEVGRASASAEREAEAILREARREAETIRARAEAESNDLVQDARARADRLVEEVQVNLEQHQHQAEDFFADARSKLGSLLRDLFDQVGATSAEQEPADSDRTAK